MILDLSSKCGNPGRNLIGVSFHVVQYSITADEGEKTLFVLFAVPEAKFFGICVPGKAGRSPSGQLSLPGGSFKFGQLLCYFRLNM